MSAEDWIEIAADLWPALLLMIGVGIGMLGNATKGDLRDGR